MKKKLTTGLLILLASVLGFFAGMTNVMADDPDTLPKIVIDSYTKTIYVTGANIETGTASNTSASTGNTGLKLPTNDNIDPKDELANALAWMYQNGLTKSSTTGEYRMYDLLTREEAAKIIGQAYTVFGGDQKIVKNTACNFKDSSGFDQTLANHISNVCQRGLFQGSDGYYFPTENLSKAQAMAVLIRMLEGKMSYELQTPWWEIYYNKGKLIGLTNVKNINEFDHPLTRYEIALMVFRLKGIMESNQMKTLALNAMAGVATSTGSTIDSQTVMDNLGTLVGGIDPSTDPELLEAISWMAENGLTVSKTVDEYKPFEVLSRIGAAKIFDKFSDMLGMKTSNEYLPNECNFSDLSGLDSVNQTYAINVCKKGLIKGSNGQFNPYGSMNKATFIVSLIRMFEGKTLDETVSPWWKNYFEKAKELGLVNTADTTTFETPISRYEVALFLYKFNIRYKMLNNLNNNRVVDEIISTVSGSIVTLNGRQKANVYINTSLLKLGSLDLGYVEIVGTRYKIVKSKEASYYTNGFMWYGDIFDIATDQKLGTINFMVMNSYVIEGTIRLGDKTYKISGVDGTSAYYEIVEL